ncbi:aminoglycoside phosphotransferase (APT) family kinase protein [Desulfobotulus alkaliphilus]|uniref:Aminoglycoside phosphotransferase (APT) family kinase protein n=1 Tax=Desulfobotulus alkaliphilus TaxID=622671 RepID=A0A562S7Y2_9BACT|nr:phosphotransferase family protein [Desulfobotulus alkaliphilus]TWI77283.1 aminoglycoside phosphotransferase (APT) family kinase protein [Desulfobotulus alkaliphilus]
MSIQDEATQVRSGEELDLKKLSAYLKDQIPHLSENMEIQQFPSGFSNLTYLLRSGDREMVLRRPPFGKKAKTAHDMGREYRILKSLRPVFPYCPEPLCFCEDPDIMGCDFYVMQRIPGIILRKKLPEGFSLSPSQASKLCENLVSVHANLHKLDIRDAGLENFGKPEGYVKRQVEGWSRRFRDARTPDVPAFEEIMAWLNEKQPGDTDRPSIIHNDFKFDNVVLNPNDPTEIIGILDWEMATLGDPLMDLGASMAYWINKTDPDYLQHTRLMPTTLEGMMTREEVVAAYAKKTGRNIQDFDFYYIFGLFRLAVIAQQIYYRFYHGQTKDQRFAFLVHAVGFFEKACKDVMDKKH